MFIASLLVVTSLAGCSTVEKLPLVPALSEKEVVDYYKTALEYETVSTRTNKVNEVTYEKTDVNNETKNMLVEKMGAIEGLLCRNEVTVVDGMSPNIHRYIKYMIDDKILSRKEVTSVTEALGHYFVDVQYNVSPLATGQFNSNIGYLGINGGYVENMISGAVSVDQGFMMIADREVNEYLVANPLYSYSGVGVEGTRAHPKDVNLYNKVAGMSTASTAAMPNLWDIYGNVNMAGLSGYGLYPQGGFTLGTFGYDRSKLGGSAVLRYVFKKDLMDPTKIEFKNVYLVKMDTDQKPNIDDSAVIPDFIQTEVEKIVERADRAISNNDVTALISGNIYTDIGAGVLYGQMHKFCNGRRHMTNVERVVGRDNHKYLAEIEITEQVGAKDASTVGTYIHKGYVVVQQVDTEFKITDYAITSTEMVKEPQIESDNTILKRLAALNLAGEVTDEAKEGITELMAKLYKGSTDRMLDQMYECFDTDTKLLSSTHREYLNSQLRGWLTKLGVDTPATYMGTVSQWIGGADDQVEFFTTELIAYEGKNKGLYMQNYYLVSCYADKWVIDEMKVVESKDVSGDELNNIRASLEKGVSVAVEGADNKVKEEADISNVE